MLDRRVTIHVFRLSHALRLSRTPPGPGATVPRRSSPAILVIPREEPLREPHLMLFPRTRHHRGMPPGVQVFAGTHIVAGLDDLVDREWREVADVLVRSRRSRIAPVGGVSRVLDRYPGCEIAVGRRWHGCLAGLRDGRLAAITEVGVSPGRADLWPAVYGSFLYGWRAARLPFEGLTTASVIVGRYTGSSADRLGSLDVAGRAQIRLARRPSWSAGGMSA